MNRISKYISPIWIYRKETTLCLPAAQDLMESQMIVPRCAQVFPEPLHPCQPMALLFLLELMFCHATQYQQLNSEVPCG